MPSRVTKLFPIFAVVDLPAALAYYRDRLGFTIAWTWGEPVIRAGVVLDDIELHLELPGPGAASGSSVVYCHMTGVENYYEACRARGAKIVMELADRPWGMRDFRVVDDSGNRLGFASAI